MTARLLAAVTCACLGLGVVLLVDPGSRTTSTVGQGLLWGLAGVLVVGVVTLVRSRGGSSARRDRDPAQ